jgi:Tfp pilus assembly protein PilN
MTMNAATIEVEGRAFNHNAIAAFMDNLDKVPEFEEPTLKDSQAQPGGIQKFVINFTYSFAPESAENPEAASGGAAQAAAPTAG